MSKGQKTHNSLREKFAETFELPKDVILGLPRVIMIGNLQMFIENHQGVIEYALDKIRISFNKGELIVNGNNLVIRNIFVEEIIIEGEIERVEFML